MRKQLYISLLLISFISTNVVSFGQDKPLEKPQVELNEGVKQPKVSVYEEFEEFIRVVK